MYYAAEQLPSVSDGLAKAKQFLRRLAHEAVRQPSRGPRKEVSRNYVPELLRYKLTRAGHAWRLTFEVDQAVLQRLLGTRFDRTMVPTNRRDWSVARRNWNVAQVVDTYGH